MITKEFTGNALNSHYKKFKLFHLRDLIVILR